MSGQTAPQNSEQIQEYQHIGAHLRDLRLHYRLKVEDVATRLHIRGKYILAIEEGRIEELPGKVYTVGYIQNYAEFLGLNGQEVLRQYQEVEQLDKKYAFRVIEPTSRQSLPSRKLLGLCAAIAIALLILSQFFTNEPQSVEEVAVEPVPERIMQQAAEALTSTRANEDCLKLEPHPAFPPCYEMHPALPPTAFIMNPVSSLLELQPLDFGDAEQNP